MSNNTATTTTATAAPGIRIYVEPVNRRDGHDSPHNVMSGETLLLTQPTFQKAYEQANKLAAIHARSEAIRNQNNTQTINA